MASDLRMTMIDTVEAMLAGKEVPGATVALVIDGEGTAAGVGYRDLERTEPLGADAQFYLYSVTKVLLATAALQLVEQGVASLDEPLGDVLPELAAEPSITLRHLLNHTAGIPDYGGTPAYHGDLRGDPGRPWTPDEFVERTLGRGLLFAPGTGWAYANVGYLLVKRLIERLTGATLREALQGTIFGPLGLERTFVAESLADAAVLTPGYSGELDDGDGVRDISGRYHPGWVSHGMVISTAAETAAIVEALFGGRLVGPGSLEAMLTAVDVGGVYPPFVRPGYGLGLMVDGGSPYGRVAGHAGGGPGFATAAFHFPDVAGRRVTAVGLVNGDRAGGLPVEVVFGLAGVG
jgi:D-alanyl-D-alanine carboxypeptidase